MYSFRLMSFNIGGFTEECSAAQHWDNRATVCVEIIRRYDPELMGLQEVQTQNRAMLDKQFTQYSFEYGVQTCHRTDENAMYNPIYWKSERFQKLDAGAFYLSETPDRWSKTWDAMHVRSATWVRLRCLKTGVTFIYANVHLDHRGSRARVESSRLIVRQLMLLRQAGNFPVIISGDFNERPWSPRNENVYDYAPPVSPQHLPAAGVVHRVYMEQNFKDAYLELGYNNQLAMNTYHDYYGDTFPPVALRIDWILTLNGEQQIQTQKYMVVHDASPPIFASDHYPIMAELVWC